MTNKIQTLFVCSACGAQFPKWSGRCLECGGWGTLRTETVDLKTADKLVTASPAETIDLTKLDPSASSERQLTGLKELDRVLGGGIMPGSLILLGGEPGIGKSTLIAQAAAAVAKNQVVVYSSGEESAGQIKSRFDRLKIQAEKIKFLGETSAEKIIATLNRVKPALAIIDSIQTIASINVAGEAGSLNQIRASTIGFLTAAKQNNIPIILIGHITKDGTLAGPKTLEHIVDTVLYLEAEASHDYRILRASKNRFGSANEIGIFEMAETGFKEVPNPALIFMEKNRQISGSVVCPVVEGSRVFLIEVQALTTKTAFGYPQRKASGFDLNRLQVLLAVLAKRANLNLINQDVVLNVVGGLKINDPGLDLAVCLAIASSLANQTVDKQTVVLGEVGLGGETRPVARLEHKLKEAERLGFTSAIIPAVDCQAKKIQLIKINSLAEIINYLKHK